MFTLTKLAAIVCILLLQFMIIGAKNNCDFKGADQNCVNFENIIKSDNDKRDIVNKINSRRNKVASGEIRSLPAAESMMKLEWSEMLAESAQHWANLCESYNSTFNACIDLNNKSIGQNIATLYGEAPQLKPSTLVDLWYMELLNINAAKIFKYEPSSKTNLGHYDYFTQLIWSETRLVGCGAAKFQEKIQENAFKNRTVYRLVCNFMPSGNIEGHYVYREGFPCTNCPRDIKCDSEYTSLCENNSDMDNIERQNISAKNNSEINRPGETAAKLASNGSDREDPDESFDIFSDLFPIDTNSTTPQTEITRLCKDSLAVDDLIDLLRKKLSTDSVLKELLLSTKSAQSDVQYSDAKVDAIVSKIYSTKTISTTTQTTDNDILNSTLLVDLVEAVIFRNRDQITSGGDTSLTSTPAIEGRTVVMQAELGEVKQNLEFTGHYFFPEEEDREENQSGTTEAYYDSSLPISEIVLEIEQLKRNKEAKDFIDEILDFDTEGSTQNHIATIGPHSTKDYVTNSWNQKHNNFKEEDKKVKRDIQTIHTNAIQYRRKSSNDESYILISYNELLQVMAKDLQDLKLNEKFHCAHNFAFKYHFYGPCIILGFVIIVNMAM